MDGNDPGRAGAALAALEELLSRQLDVMAEQLDLLVEGPRDVAVAGAGLATPASLPAPRTAESVEPKEFPLSEAQLEVWLATRLGADASRAFNENLVLRLRGALDVAALEAALDTLVARHEALRSTFSADGALQRVAPRHSFDLPLVDLSGGADVDGRVAEDVREPFDTEHGPLFRARLYRLGPELHQLVISAHHLVCDGWSAGVIFEELGPLYAACAAGTAPGLPAPMQISDYSAWLRERQAGPAAAQTEAFWLAQFAEPPPVLELPTDRPRPVELSFRGNTERRTFAPETYRNIRTCGARHGCTLSTTLLAAYNVLLHRLSGQHDIVVGISVSGQALAGGDHLVGHCTNMLPLRSRIDPERPFAEFLAAVNRLVLDAQEHRDTTFGSLIRKLKLPRDPSRTPLVSAEFTLEQEPGDLGLGTLGTEVLPDPNRFYNKDIFFNLVCSPTTLRLVCEYNTDLFDAATIRRWIGHYETLLDAIAADPDRPIAALDLLRADERRQLVEDWNATAADFPDDTILPRLIEARLAETPDAVALVCADDRLTRADLERRANRLAHYLRRRGADAGTCVGVCLDRSTDLVVALLAVLKAGAAYVPLDPGYPRQRNAFMLDDAGARLLVTHERLAAELTAGSAREAIRLDAERDAIATEPDTPPAVATGPDDLAYVIYTSGSTGRPKGVEIPHRALINFLISMAREPGLAADDTLLAVTTPSFDIAGLELYLPLVVGARLDLATSDETRDGAALARKIAAHGITAMQATPATWQMLLASGWTGSAGLRLWCGGEALPGDLARRLRERGAGLWNLYGPTETTVWSALHRVVADEAVQPIGRPIANTSLYVLDARQQPVPVGVEGSLYIGGAGVARGYRGRPELTAERFLPDPFSRAAGARIYRTGDRVRSRPDGTLCFVGREDQQVKLRGFRIELGEIDAALTRHPAVQECVTLLRQDAPAAGPGDARLVAYLLPTGPERPTAQDYRQYLRDTLPDYMIPAAFVTLERYPLTPNGKVDRRALPLPEAERAGAPARVAAAETATERTIREVWSELLGTAEIDPRDNFFDLGGHSLLAVRVIARLEQATGLTLKPTDLMFQSLGELAADLDLRRGVTVAPPAPPAAPGAAVAAVRSAAAAIDGGAFDEQIVRFGDRDCLVGLLCLPGGAAPRGPAAILVNHGMLHRVGPNRLHVKLARRLARSGHAVLRFDFSGMGDSGNRSDKLPFEQRVVVEAREAMAFLERAIGAERFVLGGLCSGAISSYNTAKADPRVAGVILMNPQFFDDELTSYVEARRTAYWRRVLTNPRRWYELFTGKAQYRMLALRIKGLFVRKEKAHDLSGQIAGDLERLVRRGTRVLLAYSAYDYGLDYLKMIVANAEGDWTRSDRLRIEKVPRADHVFTGLDSQRHLLAAVEDWMTTVR